MISYNPLKILFIDTIGLCYDGNTLSKRGLGGSESAIILMSQELTRLGFDVTVFNNCNDKTSSEGIYDGVRYVDLTDVSKNTDVFDIVISSRSVIPFIPEHTADLYNHICSMFKCKVPHSAFASIVNQAKHKVLWLHDTFCSGDHILEELVVHNCIDEVFALSDWHKTYVSTCSHGRLRNPEVLKNRIFLTRNGITRYHDEVDISAKDPNLFVYNASVTKGMIPLIETIWPKVKQKIPTAKLKVIGGFYKFRDDGPGDEQEQKFWELYHDNEKKNLDVKFTGIIKQSEIADILSQASFMIYPGAFPETFGISSLESLYYCTPLITTRFGALEETAIDDISYMIDYAIKPNSLYTDINYDRQVDQFVNLVESAYHNPYLHQQKQHACRKIKDICGWDSVALQWKQHFYRLFDLHLNVDEYRNVMKVNSKIHSIFGRRTMNKEEFTLPKANEEQRIAVVTPFYNAESYIEKCIESVAAQDYNNYIHILIDDCSTDSGFEKAKEKVHSLPEKMKQRFVLLANDENQGSVKNQIDVIGKYLNDHDIVVLLDGDDWLAYRNDIFSYINNMYDEGAEFTYGSCWSLADNIPLISQEYPREVRENKSYREHLFNWGIPYTHLRTFKKYLVNGIPHENFLDSTGEWYKAGGDGAVFYSILENADPDKIRVVQDILYIYNDKNPLNEYKVKGDEQNKNAKAIRNINKNTEPVQTENTSNVDSTMTTLTVQKKRILIAIPTARNIEPETYKSIYDLQVPEGYQTTFQYFYGYNIDQIRNLIADWVVKGYDYLFSVDSDIAFSPDTLVKLLAHEKDIVSGLYIQRKPGQHILEVYEQNNQGGVTNIPYGKIKGRGLVEIAGCGFGCTLVKAEVMKAIGYPQFKYHSALNHANTISEDVDFCGKALAKGYKIWADTTIQCSHTGSFTFNIDNDISVIAPVNAESVNIETRLRDLGSQRLLSQNHVNYLTKLHDAGFDPKVIYDIGACVLHWTNEARRIWKGAEFIAFEAMDSAEFLYKEQGLKYHIGVLSNETGKNVEFYQNDWHPGGNSYYCENPKVNSEALKYFNDQHKRLLKTVTLDDVVNLKGLPAPDLIKMDVQGAELDVLKGAEETIKTVKHVILELQRVEYNKGAPLCDIVIDYMKSIGFECQGEFSINGPDGDYHFVRRS